MWSTSSAATPSTTSSHLTSTSSNARAWSSFTRTPSSSLRLSPTNTNTTTMSTASRSTRNERSTFDRTGVTNESRVRVSVRVRPPFKDEVSEEKNFYMTTVIPPKANQDDLASITLGKPGSSKQREFLFDHTFGPTTSQASIFNSVAAPVIEDVLKGGNGTVFAYGQTGTGKTYTMGILQTVEREDEEKKGVVPRALEMIFNTGGVDVTMSFMQVYCESIQDLLGVGGAEGDSNNLQIREDPRKGFYVKNLCEYKVTAYMEAQSLINMGLENRAMAPTLMNITSSRSHTVLTVKVTSENSSHRKTGKLLLVDLAGSERIRRTTSSGVRLSEARSINASLSALGNVIAALAVGSKHVPFRDSKLTRILQDSLSGKASTALVATVGPAPVNEAESLSTLMFASRCMHVKSTPVFNEEIDYADMCAKLQVQLATADQVCLKKLSIESEKYESIIHKLATELRTMRSEDRDEGDDIAPLPHFDKTPKTSGRKRRSSFDMSAAVDTKNVIKSLVQTSGGFGPNSHDAVLTALNLSYKMLCQCADESSSAVAKFHKWRLVQLEKHKETAKDDLKREGEREREKDGMEANDGIGEGLKKSLGPHLQPITKTESRERIAARFDGPQDSIDSSPHLLTSPHPELSDFATVSELMDYCDVLLKCIRINGEKLELGLWKTSENFYSIKEDLAESNIERRGREEEVVNWSFVLKYLLSTNSKLRRQLNGRENLTQVLDSGRSKLDANAFNMRTKMSVMEDMQYDAASKIQAGFRKIRSLSDTPLPAGSPQTPMSPGSIKKILPDERVAKALIDRVSGMTEEDISALPLQAQANVRKLRVELGVDNRKIPIETEAPSFAVTPVVKSDQGGDEDDDDDEDESSEEGEDEDEDEEETDSDDEGGGFSQI
ncbi:hypothetical protein TrST_g3437 [Triparma strigata]|uniref:Kinesin-like protein n=1 Tax=Triparma strigata TaxID=1606541 RepID=A0A9W7A908_9STRA|nr:hypothetical protein TrST_g3437 [Triparma strigata]